MAERSLNKFILDLMFTVYKQYIHIWFCVYPKCYCRRQFIFFRCLYKDAILSVQCFVHVVNELFFFSIIQSFHFIFVSFQLFSFIEIVVATFLQSQYVLKSLCVFLRLVMKQVYIHVRLF